MSIDTLESNLNLYKVKEIDKPKLGLDKFYSESNKDDLFGLGVQIYQEDKNKKST